jgi:hypothetical protein
MKIVTLILLIAAALPAAAQTTATDPRWAPWVGCWKTASGAAQVCVAPSAPNAVSLTTTVEGQPELTQTLVADGAEHPMTDPDCSGAQRTEWSRDGRRLYAHAELTCKDQKPRTVSGLSMIEPSGAWLDVQSVKVDGRETTRVRRYRFASADDSSPARVGVPLTLDAIKEASRKVSPQVVEAALTETHTQFDLSSRTLIELADSGVPSGLIDVMIALSYPKHFVVERTNASAGPLFPLGFDEPFPYGFVSGWPLWSDPFGSYASGFYYPAYYYSPFAYGYRGLYYGYGYPYGGALDTGGNGGSGGSIQPSGTGRVVNGVGYTRVRPRDGGTAQPTAGIPGTASASSDGSRRPATVSSQGYSSGSSTSSSAPSSGGSSSSGSSGSSSSDSGGRTAVPR